MEVISSCRPVLELLSSLFNTHNILIVLSSQEFLGSEITKIKVPKSVEIIGQGAFESSTLQEIVFEDGSQLQEIERYVSDFILPPCT